MTPASESEGRGKNILVFETDGTGGLSQLLILRELMMRLGEFLGLGRPAYVHEHFDIVAGTGIGAIIACMVGRLRMPVQVVIELYPSISEVFSDSGRSGTTTFQASKLITALKAIVFRATGDEDTRMIDTRQDAEKCKTMVFAMPTHTISGLSLVFRSYQSAAHQMLNYRIWEALHATMAHPELFKSADIDDGPTRVSFITGSPGRANPVAHVLSEAATLYPEQHISCITNIGAGHARVIRIPKSSGCQGSLPMNALVAMKDIATDSERVAQEIAIRFRGTQDLYLRFNVDQGAQNNRLDEWERLSEVTTYVRSHICRVENQEQMGRAVTAIAGRTAISVSLIDEPMPTSLPASVKICPPPLPIFTGREEELKQIKACLAPGDRERRVCVLHGLGGTGKTQIALKAIEQTDEMWTDVVYINAVSQEEVVAALQQFALARRIGRTHDDTIIWLGAKKERWLVVFDNTDDPSLNITDFFPRGDHGSILITTRIPEIALIARGPSSGRAIENFGHLGLAIVQAGAYIRSTQMTILEYCDMFLSQRQAVIRSSGLPVHMDWHQENAYTTWRMSYKLLSVPAQQLFWLLAFLHHDNITEGMFRRAAINVQTYRFLTPPSNAEVEVHAYVKNLLQRYLDSTGAWDSGAFSVVMAELLSYLLVRYDQFNGTYNLQVLVHDWARTVVPHPLGVGIEHTTFLLALSIGYDSSGDDHIFQRALGVHVDKVLLELSKLSSNNAAMFAKVYYHMGRWGSKSAMELQVLNARRQALGEEHPHTLSIMHDLACTHQKQGRYDQAEALHIQVLDARKRVLGDEHLDTLTSLDSLALTYRSQGRFQRAETFHLQVLKVRKQKLGDNHPDTLACINSLALTYRCLLRYDQAVEFLKQVLEGYKEVLGLGHPKTLTCMDSLALTYQNQNLFAEAEVLQEQVLSARRRVIGEEHPDTLVGMGSLAYTYQRQGRYKEAEKLRVNVLGLMTKVLGEEHPETLLCMHNLALTYQSLKRYAQAETLLVQSVAAYKQVLGEEHFDTLSCIGSLASTYRSQGRLTLAESLEVEVENMRKQLFGRESLGKSHTQSKPSRNPEAQQDRLSSGSLKVEIGKDTPMSEVIKHLTAHGCPDVTLTLDVPFCAATATSIGGFSDVYEGATVDGTPVAIKCLRLSNKSKINKRAAQELYSWSKLQNDNVLPLLGLALFRKQIAMISPWMACGHLTEYTKQNPEVDCFRLLVGVTEGLAYMHSQHVLHGDLKGENVLISDDGVPKLVDFGCSTLKSNATLGFTPTSPRYTERWAVSVYFFAEESILVLTARANQAPELLMDDPDDSDDPGDPQDTNDPRSAASDVYALGMTILEVVTGQRPYHYKRDKAIMHWILIARKLPNRPEDKMPSGNEPADSLWRMLLRSWSFDRTQRPTVAEIRDLVSSLVGKSLQVQSNS